jgi:hypothetical protein
MKAIALKTLLLTLTLATPLALIPDTASASRGGHSDRGSYSSGHGSYRGSHGYGGSSRYGHSSRYGYSGSRYSNYPYSRYSRSSHYYRPRSSVSISIGSGGYYGGSYYSGFYNSLPFGYSSCVVGGLTYYNHGGRYYRPYRTGYVVVSDPYVIERRPTTIVRPTTVVTRSSVSKYESYPRIWVSGSEYLIDEGEIFKITSNGLVWAELPLGAVASSLPTHASSVWYKDVEYFEAGGIYFQRIPEGYRMVLPPWDEAGY